MCCMDLFKKKKKKVAVWKIFAVIGAAVAFITAIALIFKKVTKKKKAALAVDIDGDGDPDVVLADTTGDGVADTVIVADDNAEDKAE